MRSVAASLADILKSTKTIADGEAVGGPYIAAVRLDLSLSVASVPVACDYRAALGCSGLGLKAGDLMYRHLSNEVFLSSCREISESCV